MVRPKNLILLCCLLLSAGALPAAQASDSVGRKMDGSVIAWGCRDYERIGQCRPRRGQGWHKGDRCR
jgi:hypothetical protein